MVRRLDALAGDGDLLEEVEEVDAGCVSGSETRSSTRLSYLSCAGAACAPRCAAPAAAMIRTPPPYASVRTHPSHSSAWPPPAMDSVLASVTCDDSSTPSDFFCYYFSFKMSNSSHCYLGFKIVLLC